MKRLNLGAGPVVIEGYEARDGKKGDVLFPLPDADGSVDEIRASHVLEHFPHRQVVEVLKDWVRALKPGGVLKIAVPDFRHIAEHYLAGAQIPAQSYVMGAQADALDFHRTIFDAEILTQLLRAAGLVAIRRWTSEAKDCAALPVSLNLAGTKRGVGLPKIAAVMSVPRLGFLDNMNSVLTLAQRGIPVRKTTGAFWGQCLTRGIEMQLAEYKPDYILTIDYDTVWSPPMFETLLDTVIRHPDAAVVAPLQAKRAASHPLLFIRGADGKGKAEIAREDLDVELLPVTSAHFGLTLIRASVFEQIEKPWFCAQPDAEGAWGEGRVDDDIWFWRRLADAGLTGYVAPRVVVGHLELKITWPDINLESMYQEPTAFWNGGEPEGVWR